MKSFSGLCNVYRRFDSGFVKITAPLNPQLKKSKAVEFDLDEKEREAVDKRKYKLISSPVLAMPRTSGKFIINPDASNGQLGCVCFRGKKKKR